MLTFDITDNFTPALFKLVFIVKVYLNEFLHLIFLNFKLLDYFSKVNIGLENQVISSSNSPLPWSFFELRFLFKSSSFCISAVRYASLVSRSSTSLECWSDDSTSIRICSISLFSSSMVWNSFIFFIPIFWKMSTNHSLPWDEDPAQFCTAVSPWNVVSLFEQVFPGFRFSRQLARFEVFVLRWFFPEEDLGIVWIARIDFWSAIQAFLYFSNFLSGLYMAFVSLNTLTSQDSDITEMETNFEFQHFQHLPWTNSAIFEFASFRSLPISSNSTWNCCPRSRSTAISASVD